MIELRNITKRYGTQEAVHDLSLTIRKGQILGLLGQNGAGKTTTMNIMTGYLSPTSGSVVIDGHDLLTAPREAKRLIGYLPEQPPLYDEMTVTSYLRFACELKEVRKKDIKEHIEEILQLTGLSDIPERRVGNLSKGYRQRVGLAQALCGNPDVLVLDEPTIGLDPLQTAEFRTLIKSLGKKHTVIFSSHILSEVQAVCDRVVILHQGKMLCDSEMDTLGRREGTQLRATIALGENKLLPALRTLPCVERAEVIRGGEPGQTEVLLTCTGEQPQRALFTLLCGLQAPILCLTPVVDSLEDIFLRTTAGLPVKRAE